jgi:tRNA pseudouridine13 synthase
MLLVRKRGENTKFVANELAKVCGISSKNVGWSGLKDRHAVTEQWLSFHMPKHEEVDFSTFLKQYPHIQILKTTRHNKKLRPGDHQSNEFVVTLTEVDDVDSVTSRLELVSKLGVPNYFGEQRFGRNGNNLEEARRWGRENVRTRNQNKRSMYLSAARSWIFNQIVSKRIMNGGLDIAIDGDLVKVNNEQVLVNEDNIELLSDYKITAALAGDNDLPTHNAAKALEQAVLDSEPDLMALIRGNRMRHDRREVILHPKHLKWDLSASEVTLAFELSSGSFATSVIRELINEVAFERVFDQTND